ncbi:ankyrin repeat protein [Hypoxylon argillaceum]|nr:ankyrin repeat protein [Hypoxylon argillaceum]
MPHPHEYTIGWLCALLVEAVAAHEFLDEEHGKPDSLPAHDNNSYTLGRVGKHNVVIATLPHGEYGLVNAANAAKDMIRSFPNLRAGFMVGIGGGAPARHDIRLGDVVVSSAGSANGAVYQFDFGKTIQNKAFLSTGFLNKPPTFIMTAVSTLKARYSRKGHQLKEDVAGVLDRNTRLRKEYQRPSPSTDRLYKAHVTHSPEDNCVLYCGDDSSSLISREARAADEDDPAIHYGLIASSNQVMRDALIRDQLSAEKDVLCFEIEAAGLLNQFPFLIIRGISNYSDTHKNELWQGHAAMTAAAYTKDLLYEIAPSKVEAQKKLGAVLNGISSALSSLDQNIAYTRRHVDQKEDLEILNWLIPTDYGPQQSDYLSRRQPGTGQWLLDSEGYQNWIKEPNKTLFCPGIPGAGKTILASIVVEDLEKRFNNEITTAVAYIYCNYKRQTEQTLENLLSSLIKQLAQSQASLPHSLKELHGQHNAKKTRPSLEEVSKALESIIVQNSRFFIIVDALDECQALNGCRTKFLSTIFNLQKKTGVNIFATSKFTPEIVNHFQGSVLIEIRATKDNVRKYFQRRLLKLPKIVIDQPMLQNKIITSITEAVKGMYVYLRMMLLMLIHLSFCLRNSILNH